MNPNYGYGPIVPAAAALLVWFRIDDWKTPQGAQWSTLAAIIACVGVLLLSPMLIVEEVNPDWRLIMWLQVFLLGVITLAVLGSLGGLRWAIAGFPFVGMLSLCVPWPTPLEDALLSALLQTVSTSAADLFYLFGFDVIQKGNLLWLDGVPLGIDEACSGIRSLQVSVVLLLFLLLWRPLSPPRALLFVIGTFAVCWCSNLCRILALGLVGAEAGPSAIARWHDLVGWSSTTMIFGGIGLLRWLVTPVGKDRRKEHSRLTRFFKVRALQNRRVAPWTQGATIVFVIFALWAPLSVFAFYNGADENYANKNRWGYSFDWSLLGEEVEFRAIPSAVSGQLRYSHASYFSLSGPLGTGKSVQAYEFGWEDGLVSSFTAVHRPQNCLPSIGYRMVAEARPFFLRLSQGSIPVHPYVFELDGHEFFVFHALWDVQSGKDVIGNAAFEARMDAVWARERFGPRQAILMILVGEPNLRSAVRSFAQIVRQAEVPGA